MERRDRSRVVGALKETVIQIAIALGKPDLTLNLSRKFGREEKEQVENWREAHVVAGDKAAQRMDEASLRMHADAMNTAPPALRSEHRS